MRELILKHFNEWFGPVLDADGVRVRWRTSRTACALVAVTVLLAAATLVLAALALTGMFTRSVWPATMVAMWVCAAAANKQLRRTV